MQQYTIFFGNSLILTHEDRECACNDDASMFAVFDSLCIKFLHVIVYDTEGKIVREYKNIYWQNPSHVPTKMGTC